VYIRKEIRPRVIAICAGGLEGRQHQEICMAVAETLGSYQPIAGAGVVSPFCERICWSSCHGESHAGGNVRKIVIVIPPTHPHRRLFFSRTGRRFRHLPVRGLRAVPVPQLFARLVPARSARRDPKPVR
jgi:hypothetical protein